MSPKYKNKSSLAIIDTRKKSRLRTYAIIAAVVIVLVAVGGIFYYSTYIAPFRKVILTVDNQTIRMDYFLKRIKMSPGDQAITLQQVTYEQIVKLLAPEYNVTVSPSEVDQELRQEAASSANTTVTSGFTEWYADRLKNTGLSDGEYRDIVRANLLAERMLEILAANLPTVTAQVHVYTILTASPADALSAAARVTSGDNFSAVAREISLDSFTRSIGGDLGWLPRGITPYDDVIFSLAPGQISKPVALDPASPDKSQYAVFMVEEWDPSRVIAPGPMGILRSKALFDVIQEEIPGRVRYAYTPEDTAWVDRQTGRSAGK